MRARTEQRILLGAEAIQRFGDSALLDGKKALLADCLEAYIDSLAEFQGMLETNATGRVLQMHKTRVRIATELTNGAKAESQ